jgi:tRNA dimethylallyltransferase
VINIDSQQVYRGMEIGTAQPSEGEKRGVPHHLYGVVDPAEEFNAAKYAGLADAAIADAASRGRVPILVGGTQLYYRALTRGLCGIPDVPAGIRRAVREEVLSGGSAAAHGRLALVDPVSARRISPGDSQRVMRALEVFDAAGVPISEFQAAHSFSGARYEGLRIAIRVPRAELHRRIDRRTAELYAGGFVDEARALLDRGLTPQMQSFKAHGFRYAAAAALGEMTLERAIELTARDTRRYARRQETWLRSEPDVRWVDPPPAGQATRLAAEFLAQA